MNTHTLVNYRVDRDDHKMPTHQLRYSDMKMNNKAEFLSKNFVSNEICKNYENIVDL